MRAVAVAGILIGGIPFYFGIWLSTLPGSSSNNTFFFISLLGISIVLWVYSAYQWKITRADYKSGKAETIRGTVDGRWQGSKFNPGYHIQVLDKTFNVDYENWNQIKTRDVVVIEYAPSSKVVFYFKKIGIIPHIIKIGARGKD
jgi:hypothetical protein